MPCLPEVLRVVARITGSGRHYTVGVKISGHLIPRAAGKQPHALEQIGMNGGDIRASGCAHTLAMDRYLRFVDIEVAFYIGDGV